MRGVRPAPPGPGCLEVRDNHAEANGTSWTLCPETQGESAPVTLVSYLNSLSVRQRGGSALNASVISQPGGCLPATWDPADRPELQTRATSSSCWPGTWCSRTARPTRVCTAVRACRPPPAAPPRASAPTAATTPVGASVYTRLALTCRLLQDPSARSRGASSAPASSARVSWLPRAASRASAVRDTAARAVTCATAHAQTTRARVVASAWRSWTASSAAVTPGGRVGGLFWCVEP